VIEQPAALHRLHCIASAVAGLLTWTADLHGGHGTEG
jgi:hypothetical protein